VGGRKRIRAAMLRRIWGELKLSDKVEYPEIDLAMLVLDRPHYTELAIYRLFLNTLYPWDKINFYIIDDGSTKEMAKRLDYLKKMYPERIKKVIHHDLTQGIARNINEFVFKYSEAPLMGIIFNDALVVKGWLKVMVSALISKKFQQEKVGVIGMRNRSPKDPNVLLSNRIKYRRCPFTATGFIAWKRIFDKCGRIYAGKMVEGFHHVRGWGEHQRRKGIKVVELEVPYENLQDIKASGREKPHHILSLDKTMYADYMKLRQLIATVGHKGIKGKPRFKSLLEGKFRTPSPGKKGKKKRRKSNVKKENKK